MNHLTLSDRIRIESMLETDSSFSVMARALNRSPSTISREIRKHRCVIPHYSNPSGRKRSECEHAKSCRVQFLCGNPRCSSFCSKCRSKRCTLYCSLFSPRKCERLKQPPYVCNHCPELRPCSHDFYFYRAKHADDIYHNIKTLSRSGINQTPESLEQLDKLISPLLKQGQPLSHIYLSYSTEIPCSQRTLYNYIDQKLFTAINLDLPRKVRYKPRKQHHKEREIPGYRENRTYTDFEHYLTEYPESKIVEMDIVEGSGGKKEQVLLTFFFRGSMLIFLLPAARRIHVREVFDFLYDQLQPELFGRLFSVILTDNDSTFKDTEIFERENGQGVCTRIFYCDPMASWQKGRLEKNHEFIRYILPKGCSFSELTQKTATQGVCTRIFYCDPMASWQKGRLEKNHEFIRYILPKGCSFSELTQKTATQIANHINSTARASLNGHTPFELAQLLLDKKLIQICHLNQIPSDQVTLKPSLIK